MSAICFNLDQSKILSSGNGLTHDKHLHLSKQRAFIEDKKCDFKIERFMFGRVENICGKRRKCFSSFHQNVLKNLLLLQVGIVFSRLTALNLAVVASAE